MPNIATVLREEITRLARKEIKAQTAALRKSSAQHRKDIAALKRDLKVAQRRIAVLETEVKKRHKGAVDKPDTKGKRFSARAVKAHREKLDLSAANYGKLCGVSGATVYLWEQGKSRPRSEAFARWIDIRSLGKRAALTRLG